MNINILIDILINIFSLILGCYIFLIFFDKSFPKKRFDESKQILKKLESITIKEENINFNKSEEALYSIEDARIWTLNKNVSYQHSKRLTNQLLVSIKSLGIRNSSDYSSRECIFDNFLREYGNGLVSINSKSIIIITNSGSKIININRIFMYELISDDLLLLIEKNDKSIIIKSQHKILKIFIQNLDFLLNKDKQLKEQIYFTLENLGDLSNSGIKYKICEVKLYESILNKNVTNITSLVAQILIYYINYGLYIDCDNVLVSNRCFYHKNGNEIKEQIKVGNVYINMSKFLKNEIKITQLINILKIAKVDVDRIIIKVTYM